MKPSAPAPIAYGVADAAAAIGSSPTIIRGLIRDNKLPAKKLGSKVIILADDLVAFFDTLKDA